MRLISRLVAFGSCVLLSCAAPCCYAQKEALYASIHRRDAQAWQAAQTIWGWAEPGYQEQESAKLLAAMLEEAGFQVRRGVAEIPTAFLAELGSEKPIIGILGEYDAPPGLSQEAVPYRQPREGAHCGHGCGHHLFGVASASAAIAIAEQIRAKTIKGTIRYYGCPAEEGGGGKVFMVRAGLFDDCDAVLHWHPGDHNAAGDGPTLARMAAKFRFFGKSAHAAVSPEQGRSALDAVELTNHAAQLLREHTPDFTRIHHVITHGGEAPNVVPDCAEVFYYIRHPKSKILRPLYGRLVKCAQAGALATGTELEIEYLGGYVEILPNDTMSQVAMENFEALNDLEYSQQEREFAEQLQTTLEKPQPLESIKSIRNLAGTIQKGSTDVGDVSWVVPATRVRVACWVPGTPSHSWQAVACGNTSIARKGMNLAARVLAATAYDLYRDPAILKAARAELQERTRGEKYQSLLQPGQKPPLDYRKPWVRRAR